MVIKYMPCSVYVKPFSHGRSITRGLFVILKYITPNPPHTHTSVFHVSFIKPYRVIYIINNNA